MKLNQISNSSSFGKLYIHDYILVDRIGSKISKIEKAANGNDVYVNEDIDPTFDVCYGWTVSMPASKSESEKFAFYSAKIPFTNENLVNFPDRLAEAIKKLSQIV